MTKKNVSVGLSSDLFDTNGRPMFGDSVLSLFSDAGVSWSALPITGGQLPDTAFADYEGLMIGGSKVSEKELANESGKLRIIARNGVGYDAVDTNALTQRGILLTNTPIPVRNAVATTAVAFILALTLRLPLKSRLAREQGRWRERGNYPGLALAGRTLGIIGLGGIGSEFVRLMQPFGMAVLATDPHIDASAAAQAGATLTSLEQLLKQSDVVVVACLLNESTRRLLNAERLHLMKPTAYLINVARGPIIDEAALIEALRAGQIAGAGLDVFEKEPPDPDNPLLSMETVIPTAHCLCWTDSFVESVAQDAISGIIAALNGHWPEYVVNPAAKAHARVQKWMRSA
jgi:phosphoglycerate dehydrogenase-like enzyme